MRKRGLYALEPRGSHEVLVSDVRRISNNRVIDWTIADIKEIRDPNMGVKQVLLKLVGGRGGRSCMNLNAVELIPPEQLLLAQILKTKPRFD